MSMLAVYNVNAYKHVYYSRAAKEGLNVSLMERLDKLYGDEITYMLQVQYRYCEATHLHTYVHINNWYTTIA